MPTKKTERKTYIQWLDYRKHCLAHCLDPEKMDRMEFAITTLLEAIIDERGCSANVAKLYAETLFKKLNNIEEKL